MESFATEYVVRVWGFDDFASFDPAAAMRLAKGRLISCREASA
jgi:hypothetical protein